MSEFYKILSIDGGGIKGVFPATFLSSIENDINGQIYEYFDLITGTSTGGLIALGLALGKPAVDIKNLYLDKGGQIFRKALRSRMGGIFTHKYSGKNLKNNLINFYGEETILDQCKTRVCIPSCNVTENSIKVFKTRHHDDYNTDYRLPIWQIGMSTSSAPSFFPAYSFKHEYNQSLFVDGGLWANNPTLIAVSEALKLGVKMENIKILSIGTGQVVQSKSRKALEKYGIIAWNRDIIEYVFHVQSLGVENITKYLGADIERVNCKIDKKAKLDNTKNNIEFQAHGIQKYQETNIVIKEKFFKNKVILYKEEIKNVS